MIEGNGGCGMWLRSLSAYGEERGGGDQGNKACVYYCLPTAFPIDAERASRPPRDTR